jgi:hypothetical protein
MSHATLPRMRKLSSAPTLVAQNKRTLRSEPSYYYYLMNLLLLLLLLVVVVVVLLLLLLLYKLPHLSFCLYVFCCCFVLLTPADFVIGFWAVKFVCKK